MQRIFKYGDTQNISLTSDKELNILVYCTPSYVIIYRSHVLSKMVHFFGPPCTMKRYYAKMTIHRSSVTCFPVYWSSWKQEKLAAE